jgi:beta-phosphoglucomutase-like phosphatase (HAD superfamily)
VVGRYLVAIASSGSRNGILKNIEPVGIGQYLTVIVGDDEVQNSRPALDIYLEAVARLNVAADHCLALEKRCQWH